MVSPHRTTKQIPRREAVVNSLRLAVESLRANPGRAMLAVLGIVIGIITGLIVDLLVKAGVLAPNPHQKDLPEGFKFWPAAKTQYADATFDGAYFWKHTKRALAESRMIIRWILFS